jgi:phosphoribosylaminoimidazole carboxylase (NCAIR synthetase)
MMKRIVVNIPNYSMVASLDELKPEFQYLDKNAILKSGVIGYNGKGISVIKNESDLENMHQKFWSTRDFH